MTQEECWWELIKESTIYKYNNADEQIFKILYPIAKTIVTLDKLKIEVIKTFDKITISQPIKKEHIQIVKNNYFERKFTISILIDEITKQNFKDINETMNYLEPVIDILEVN